MSVVSEFAIRWGAACAVRGLTKFFAEVPVLDSVQTSAGRMGREFVAASALTPRELDDVLSEIALLTMGDDDEPAWLLARLGPDEVAAVTAGAWTTHFAKSFFRATSQRPMPRHPGKRGSGSRRPAST